MKRLTTKIDDTYTCSYCENQEAVDKLGMLEDFLEETGIMDLSELKQILTTNIVWQQNEQLKDRWQKLEESILEFKNRDDTTDDDTAGLWFVIEKMKELEKDDE